MFEILLEVAPQKFIAQGFTIASRQAKEAVIAIDEVHNTFLYAGIAQLR